MIDYNKPYWRYCKDILDGKIPSGNYIKLACKRMLAWNERNDIFLDEKKIDKMIRFISLMDLEYGKFKLLDYQAWILANVFGWYYKDSPERRVVNNVLLLTARKSGKSTFAAAIAICAALLDGQKNPEIAFIANSQKQATMLFKYCKRLCESLDPKRDIFKTYRKDIRIPELDGQINVLSSDTSKLDGRSDTVFIQDEGHDAKNFEIWNGLKNGQAARKNPLAISISTAGFNLGEFYPLYSQWSYCVKILEGAYDDDTWFAAIFQLDEGDDWTDEKNWIKSNPNLGVATDVEFIRNQVKSAKQSPANEVSIKTKNFNIWCQTAETWIYDDVIKSKEQQVNLDDFLDEESYIGVDLSSIEDLSSFTVLIPPNPARKKWADKFIFKNYIYIPGEAFEKSVNKDLYRTFYRNGYVRKTPGNVVDYDYILKEQLEINKKLFISKVGYDAYNATQWAINAQDEGLILEPFAQGIGNFNKPTKFLQLLILSDKVIIDTNPCVRWCFQNVVIKEDYNGNMKPMKQDNGKDRSKKIDPVISMIESLGMYLNNPNTDISLVSI